jgi:hypothetical protein
MNALLQIKYRAFTAKLKASNVSAMGEDTTTNDELLRAAFFSGANAQREIYEDDEQMRSIEAETNPPYCTSALRASMFVLGCAIGCILTIVIAVFVLQPK